MYCGECGTNVPDTSKFCNGCGSPMQSANKPPARVERVSVALVAVSCPVCGGPIKTEDSRCGYCGSVIVIKLDMPKIDPGSLKLGVIDQHIKEFRGRVRADRNDEEAHYGLGIAYFNLGLTDEAIDQIEEAVRLMPENPNIQLQLGLMHSKQITPRRVGSEWSKSAIQSLFRVDRALVIRPNMLEALLFRAALFSDPLYFDTDSYALEDYVDDLIEAIDCWDRAVEIDPDSIRYPIADILHSDPLPSRTTGNLIPNFAEILKIAPQFQESRGTFGRNSHKVKAAMDEYEAFMDGTILEATRLIDALLYVLNNLEIQLENSARRSPAKTRYNANQPRPLNRR